MRLASFRTAQGASYGAVTNQGIVDLGRRLGNRYSDLRTLLERNGLEEARKAAGAAAVPAPCRIAGGPPAADPAPARVEEPRLRGGDRGRHWQGWTENFPEGFLESHRRLQLLQRRLGARLAAPHRPVDRRQELRQHRRLRPLAGDRRRDPRGNAADAVVPPERRAHAARHHRADDLQDPEADRVHLELHHAAPGRRHRHRHAGRRRRAAQPAGLDEARRYRRDRDRQGRRAGEQHRRRLIRSFIFILGAGLSAAACGQPYPERPIRFYVGFPPGGSTDLVSRFLGQKLAERLKQPVVVEQKVGGTGLIANDAIAKAPPDGHTMVLLTGGHPGTAAVMKKLPYDPVRDFGMVSTVIEYPMVISVAPDSPIKSLPDLFARAKAQPGRVSFSSAGPGSLHHLLGEWMNIEAGTSMLHVPRRS